MSDRIEAIRNSDDLGLDRNLFSCKAVRITAPVETLMMPAHRRNEALKRLHRPENRSAHDRMLLHPRSLFVGQALLGAKKLLLDSDHPEIVE